MQINVALENNSDEQAEIIRKKWYKTTTAQQTRDAFIFNECVDRFSGEPEDLIPYIGKDEGSTIVQRRLTIKSESNDRLKTIAAAINKPLASTYRAIIAYTLRVVLQIISSIEKGCRQATTFSRVDRFDIT